MAEGAAANEEAPTGKRRLGRLAFLAVVIPLVLAAALYLLRGVIFAPSIKSALVSACREHLGIGITVEAIGGSYLGSFTISGLRTVEEGTLSPLTSLDVEKIELRYSLLSLLKGMDAFLTGLQIELRSARAAVDLGMEGSDDGGVEGGGGLNFPLHLPRLRLRDSSLFVKAPGYSFHADGLTGDIFPDSGDASSIVIGAGAVKILHPRFPVEPFSLNLSLGYTPAAVTVKEVRAGEAVIVEEGRLTLDEMPSAFSFSAAAELFGGSLNLSGGKRDGILHVRLEAKEADLGLFSDLFPVPELDPKGVLSAKIEIQFLPAAPFGVEGEFGLSLEGGAVRGIPVNRLLLAASLREGRLEVARLEGETAATAVDLRNVNVPLKAALAGEWKAFLGGLEGEVALDSADVPAFLALWGVDIPAAPHPSPPHRLLMEGKMDDGKLSIASGRLETEGGSVQMGGTSVAFPGPEEGWRETSMKADLTVALDDLALLPDLFPLPDLAGSLTGKVLLEGAVLSPRGAVDLAAKDLVVGGRPVGDVSLEARLDGRTITVEEASLRQEGAANVVELKKVTAPAEDLLTGSWRRLLQSLEGGFSLRLADLPVFLDMLGADAPHGAGEVPKHTLVLDGAVGEGIFRIPSGSLDLAGEEIVLDRWEVSLPGPEDPWRETSLAGTLRVDLSDLEVLGDLLPLPHLAGSLKGEATVSGTVGVPMGSMHLEGKEVVVGELPLGEITVDVTSGAEKALALSLDLESGDDASGGGQGYTLSLGTSLVFAEQEEGTIDATVEILKVARGGLSLDLVRPAAFSRQADGSYIVDGLELRGDTGSLTLGGMYLPGGDADLLLEVVDLRGEGWLEEFAGDRITFRGLDGSVRFTGRSAAPEITVTGTVSHLEGKRSPSPVSGEFLVVYSGGKGLRFERFELSVAQGQKITIAGFLPLDPAAEDPFAPGEISLTVAAEVPDLEVLSFLLPEEYAFAGSLEGTADLSGSWEKPEGKVDLSLRILELPPALQPAPPGPFDLTARLEREGSELRVDPLEIISPAVKGELSGSWTGLPSPVAVIRGEVPSLPGDVSLEGRFSSLNAGWMARLAEGVRYVEGAVEGDITIAGPVANPDLRATVKVVDGEVSSRGLPLLSGLDVECRFADRTLHLGKIEGEVGGAPFNLSGRLSFDSFADPEIDLRLRGKRLLLFRSGDMRVRSDVDLTAKGPLSKLTLAGDLLLTDSRFVKNIDVLGSLGGERPPPIEGKGGLFSFRDPPLRDLVFDLRIKTGEPFLVRNQYVRGTFRPDLTLTGTGEQPLLLGEVKIDPFRLNLPTGVLKTDPGIVAFLASDPDRPRIDVKGSTRLIGYDIIVEVEGFLDDMRVILSSLPSLPDDELLLLLLTGTPPASGDQEASASAAGAAMAVFLGRSFFARYFGSEEGANEMIQDRFETFIGRDISEKGDMTIESTFRLKEEVFRKGDTLYIVGEKDKYDDVNYGVRLTVEFQDDEETGK